MGFLRREQRLHTTWKEQMGVVHGLDRSGCGYGLDRSECIMADSVYLVYAHLYTHR